MQDDQIGFGRPPVHSRFKKGTSGNPGGRPKQQPTFRDQLLRELQQPAADDPGKPPATKAEVLIKRLIDASVDGNLRAVGIVLSILGSEAAERAGDDTLSEADRALLNEFRSQGGGSDRKDPDESP